MPLRLHDVFLTFHTVEQLDLPLLLHDNLTNEKNLGRVTSAGKNFHIWVWEIRGCDAVFAGFVFFFKTVLCVSEWVRIIFSPCAGLIHFFSWIVYLTTACHLTLLFLDMLWQPRNVHKTTTTCDIIQIIPRLEREGQGLKLCCVYSAYMWYFDTL